MKHSNSKRDVWIIDADTSHSGKVSKALQDLYNIDCFENTGRLFEEIKKGSPAAMLITGNTSPENCVDIIHKIREIDQKQEIVIIYIAGSEIDPKIEKSKQAGANATLSRPYSKQALLNTVSNTLNQAVERQWDALPETQKNALKQSSSIFSDISNVISSGHPVEFNSVKDNCQPLVDAIETGDFLSILDGVKNHDDYTYAHSMRVATLLTLLGHEAGFNNDEQLLLSSGGLVHDVGKMMIPHEILNKPGRLTDEEFEIMKSHVAETMTYLDTCDDIPKGVRIIAEQHHEKIDGTGYPHNLQGKDLNELARMAAVVDVFSALTDRRVYKEPMPTEKAIKIMTEEMTSHLDQHFVKMFEKIAYDAKVIQSAKT